MLIDTSNNLGAGLHGFGELAALKGMRHVFRGCRCWRKIIEAVVTSTVELADLKDQQLTLIHKLWIPMGQLPYKIVQST